MIVVENPGLLTTVQDEGRIGFRSYGVPIAGVMDRYAYNIANILVNNCAGAAVLEMTMLGGEFYFESDQYVAVCGADMKPVLNGSPVLNWSCFFVPAGSQLKFSYATKGCRSYLAVHGGIDVPLIMGSRSTYLRGNLGGLEGRKLGFGDKLAVGENKAGSSFVVGLNMQAIPEYLDEVNIRVMLGPQANLFKPDSIDNFLKYEFCISQDSDRMGYRLEGPTLQHKDKADIISDAICPGSIQVPGHGNPIILMADAQTTGGYAKIGTVISTDLTKLAQCRPGQRIRFVLCSEEEAVNLLRNERQMYLTIHQGLCAKSNIGLSAIQLQVKVNGVSYQVRVEEINDADN